MSSSNVEETSEQTHGREIEPIAHGKGKKNKSCDALANTEARLAKVELAMANTRERVEGIEDLREHIQDFHERVLSHKFNRSWSQRWRPLLHAWMLCRHGSCTLMTHKAPRLEVPKPHMFNGKKNAKELDNFLWHMERFVDIENGMCTIHTRDAFKREIKRQFYPEDVTYLARKKMKHLKHMGSIREYVKEFSTLMFEIPNMSEEELLFNFMDNLQSWVEQELRRCGVQDLAMTMAIANNHAKGRGDKGSRGYTPKE
ncbi:hypothetical protein AAG906_000885 [Vitis piasezkii]